MSANNRQLNSRGFTLVELNLTIAMMAIMSISFMAIFSTFIVTTTRINYSIDMTNESQNLLRILVEELRYGSGVRQTNSLADPSNAGGWNTGNTNFVIITAVPALDAAHNYIIDAGTGNPYLNEYVYYKQGSLLYKRTLANTAAVGNQSKTSYPPGAVPLGFPADRKLVENLKTITFNLYDQDDASTTTALLARSVKIDLTLERKSFGTALSFDNSVRTTLRNSF